MKLSRILRALEDRLLQPSLEPALGDHFLITETVEDRHPRTIEVGDGFDHEWVGVDGCRYKLRIERRYS